MAPYTFPYRLHKFTSDKFTFLPVVNMVSAFFFTFFPVFIALCLLDGSQYGWEKWNLTVVLIYVFLMAEVSNLKYLFAVSVSYFKNSPFRSLDHVYVG